jgi:biopolymer transport protein TolR
MMMGPPTGGSGNKHRTQVSMAEINVTPMVDVMLVLLIIFMVAAPMMQQGMNVDLPKANTGALDERLEPVMISLDANRKVSIDGKAIAAGTLRANSSLYSGRSKSPLRNGRRINGGGKGRPRGARGPCDFTG